MATLGALELMSDQTLEYSRWLSALASENSAERSDAAESPPEGASADEVVAGLIPLLQDSCDVVRLCAAETLGRFPGPRTAAALRDFVAREDDPLTKAYGLSSLGLVGTSQDLTILLSDTSEDRPAQIRIHALVGLYELVRRGVKHGLIAMLSHESPDVRGASAEALATVLENRDDSDAIQSLERRAGREPLESLRDDITAALRRLQSIKEDPSRDLDQG